MDSKPDICLSPGRSHPSGSMEDQRGQIKNTGLLAKKNLAEGSLSLKGGSRVSIVLLWALRNPITSRGGVMLRGRGGFGRGRGRGRGRGAARPALTREQLDNQLDAYMSKTKGHLDAELDAYMAQADPESND
ncbi:unnamed protein product [Ranitomeya imitator]|uniref:Chromatin target of PRMT1 protein C-terminal domain-containing protein n=1 Tax=Ranitomeya imitator TaxID=111125 RepID=A0ABN9LTV5_9NEOB|nr:unnamed protein product [Ranitomeya imitator]